jgi:hypothetical protein
VDLIPTVEKVKDNLRSPESLAAFSSLSSSWIIILLEDGTGGITRNFAFLLLQENSVSFPAMTFVRHKMVISYNGMKYNGWEIQTTGNSILGAFKVGIIELNL